MLVRFRLDPTAWTPCSGILCCTIFWITKRPCRIYSGSCGRVELDNSVNPRWNSHAMTSFFAGLIHAMEQKTGNVGWNDREMGVLRAIRNANPTTGVRMRDRRQELAAKEDKHVFAIADMIRLGRQIGFSEVEYVNAYDPPKIGADHQHSLSVQLSRYSVPLEKLEPYNFIFQEFSDTFGLAMGKSAPFNFGYFIFRK